MAQIVTITNPLTGQPAQVDQLEHTAQEIDDAIARALPGGEIDITMQQITAGTDAAEYSATATYAMGDYCTHDGKLYRCTTAITEAEAWTEAHWTETTVGAELTAIYTALQKKVDLGEDGKVPAEQVDAYSRSDSISAGTRTALSLPETATPDDALAEIARQLSEGGGYIESTDYPGCYYRTVDGVTEWLNPPMELGVEYRTTERHLGKPVYVKLVNFGALPNASTSEVSHNISDIDYIVSVTGTAKNTTDGWTFNFSSSPRLPYVSALMVSSQSIIASTSVDWSEYNLYVTIKYTKTTD